MDRDRQWISEGATVRSYMGRVEAWPGELLLGGVPVHWSARFETVRQAARWMAAVLEGNVAARREVRSATVVPSALKPEIPEEVAA